MASLTSTDILNRETHVATSTVPGQLRDESDEIIIEQFKVPKKNIKWTKDFISGPIWAISIKVLNAFYGVPDCSIKRPDCSCIPTCCCPICPTFSYRVYLTDKSVKIVYQVEYPSRRYLCCMYSGFIADVKTYVFALTEIADIQVLANPISAGYGKWGTEIAEPTTIVMEIKPERAKQFFIIFSCCNLPTVIQISCKEGASDFVRAVKRQMLTMARE